MSLKINLMKMGLIAVGFMLAGCLADTPSNPIARTVVLSTEPGNTVSIGTSGTNFKTASESASVFFEDLPEGDVDVHIFSSDGYTAISYYNITTGWVAGTTFAQTSSTALSVIDIYVTAINDDGYGLYHLAVVPGSVTKVIHNYAATKNTSTNIVSFIVNLPPGTVATGNLHAVKQGGASSTAGNILKDGATEVLGLGQTTYITQDVTTYGTSAQAEYHAGFSTAVIAPVLATIQSVLPPSGMQVDYMSIYGVDIDPYTANSLMFPDTIRSAPLRHFSLFRGEDWTVFASGSAGDWFKTGSLTLRDTLNIAATMSSVPSVETRQLGNTISWVESSDNHTFNRIIINDSSNKYRWVIHTPKGVNSITLPTVPTGIQSPLAVGVTYSLTVVSIDSSDMYEWAAGRIVITNAEGLASPSVNYTR